MEQATSQVLDAVARLEQRLQQQPATRQQHSATPAPALPRLPPELQEPSALTNLLSALERVEQQERDIHSRWFSSGSGSSGADGNGVSSSSGAVGHGVSSSSMGAVGPHAEASDDSGFGAAEQAPVAAAVGEDSANSKQVREGHSSKYTATVLLQAFCCTYRLGPTALGAAIYTLLRALH